MTEDHDDPLTQDQMRNMAIAGFAEELYAIQRALARMEDRGTRADAAQAETAAKTQALYDVFLTQQPGHADTLADRLLRDDMQRQAAQIMAEEVRKKGAVAAALIAIAGVVSGATAAILKLGGNGGSP
jgi:hypothetical protein